MSTPTIAIIGAGPAGVRAAQVFVAAGLRPLIFDEGHRPGGQIYRQPPEGAERPAKDIYGLETHKAINVHTAFEGIHDKIDYRPRTMVWNVFENHIDSIGPRGYERLRFDRLILATGAMDRILPFPGWTIPGVYTLGAAQIALKSQGMAIGKRVALVGAGPLLPLIAHQYAKAGGTVVAVLDVTPFAPKMKNAFGMLSLPGTFAKGIYYTTLNALRGLNVKYGVRSIAVDGGNRVESLNYVDAKGEEHRVAVDGVAASFGLRSESQLADVAGCEFTYDEQSHQWRPAVSPEGRSSVDGIYLAGDGVKIGGADNAELQGRRTGLTVLEDIGFPGDAAEIARLDRLIAKQAVFRSSVEAAYPFPQHIIECAPDDLMLCRCEGISVGALRNTTAANSPAELNRLKAFTRIGMGRCQGRSCGQAAAELMALARGQNVESSGRIRAQPPIKPLMIDAFVGAGDSNG